MNGTFIASALSASTSTGIVSDSCATDPTAAAFFATAASRYDVKTLATALRRSSLLVEFGAASRPLACPAGPCCASDRAGMARALRDCPPGERLVGLFGDMRSALAGECGLLDGPSLTDMTTAALARLRAVERGRPAFLVVAGDRIDAAAHAGDAAAVAAGLADFAGAVRAAIAAASARSDSLVIVTGDHMTIIGTAEHSAEGVPILAYGGLAAPLPQDMSHRDLRGTLKIQEGRCAA